MELNQNGDSKRKYHLILLTTGFARLISCIECRIIPLLARIKNEVLKMPVYFGKFLMKKGAGVFN